MTTSGLSTAAAGLHRWGLPRGLIVLLGGAAIVIIVAGIQGVAWLIGPAFMALIVVIAVAPAQSWLRRKGWPGWATTLVGLSVTVTFLALVFWAWLIGPLGAILAIPLTLLAKAMLVDVDPHAGWADALLRASATKPESPSTDGTATAAGTPSATDLAGAAAPTSPQAEGSLPSEPRVHDPHVT